LREEYAAAAAAGRRSVLAGDIAEQAAGNYEPLNLAGSFVDLGDLGVAEIALGREVLGVAVAAKDLDRLAGPVPRDAAGKELGLRPFDRVRKASLF